MVRRALAQGLVGLAGRAAVDLVPEEMVGAFAAASENTRRSNKALLAELRPSMSGMWARSRRLL